MSGVGKAARQKGNSMAYSDFTLRGVKTQFNLTIEEADDLFVAVPAIAPRPEFLARLKETSPLALAVGSEKARSEFLIAPVLSEAWFLGRRRTALFSGVDFDIDVANGLSGYCDYIVTRSPEQLYIEAPVVMLVEAKKEDMKKGYGQCLAEMIAAQRFNERENNAIGTIYGAVTTGDRWKFLELEGATARIDAADYYIEKVGKILGILLHLTGTPLP